MSIQISRIAGLEVLRAAGLSTERCVGLTVEFEADCPVVVHARYYVDEKTIEAVKLAVQANPAPSEDLLPELPKA